MNIYILLRGRGNIHQDLLSVRGICFLKRGKNKKKNVLVIYVNVLLHIHHWKLFACMAYGHMPICKTIQSSFDYINSKITN
jgi:hypothetical protein